MPIVKNFVSNSLINGLILYLIAKYLTKAPFNFQGFVIKPISSLSIEQMILLGFIFYLIYFLLRRIVNLVALPFRILSFGIISVLINVGMLYLFQYISNYVNLGVGVELGNFFQVFVLSIVIYLFNLLLK